MHCAASRLKSQLERFQVLRAAVPPVLTSLLKPYVDYCDEAFSPGVSALTWASMNLDVCVLPFHSRTKPVLHWAAFQFHCTVHAQL